MESREKSNFYSFEVKKSGGGLSKMSSSEGRAMFENFNNKDKFYSDFAIFHNQNCIPSWRKCKVVNDEGKTLAVVSYQDKKGNLSNYLGEYLVPRYEIICLDEV